MHCFGFKKNVSHTVAKNVCSLFFFFFFLLGNSFFSPNNKRVSRKPSLFLLSSFPSGLLKYDLCVSPLHSSSTPLLFCSPMHARVLSSVLYQISNFCRPTADCLFCWTWRIHGWLLQPLYCWSWLQREDDPIRQIQRRDKWQWSCPHNKYTILKTMISNSTQDFVVDVVHMEHSSVWSKYKRIWTSYLYNIYLYVNLTTSAPFERGEVGK